MSLLLEELYSLNAGHAKISNHHIFSNHSLSEAGKLIRTIFK